MLRVAGLLYLDPSRPRRLSDVTTALPDLNRQTVIRALNDLVDQGYLIKVRGNPPTYRPDERHFLFNELRAIAVKTLGGTEGLVEATISEPAVRFAAIYGSFARGEAGPKSDIDLLLVIDPEETRRIANLVADLADTAHSIGREINPTIYDEREFAQKRRAGLLAKVLAGPLMVLKDDGIGA